MSRRGFTLIEVMISMAIMAMLTVLVSQSIRSAVQNKKKLEARMAAETTLYDALRVMKLDIERAFNYQDVFFEIENIALQQLDAEKPKNQNGQTDQREQRPPPIKLTHFLGELSSVHFTALNHYRTKYNAPESDQMEVGYYVDSCERPDGEGTTKCLWRRTSPLIDDEVDQGGAKVVVAHNVTRFELAYRSDRENEEWIKQWRSDNKGRNDHRNNFPHFVKVDLEIEDEKSKKARAVQQSIVIQIAFPNNESHLQQTGRGAAPNGQPANGTGGLTQ